MREVRGPAWEREFGHVFRRMFRGTDPFDAPHTEALPARALLFPVPFLLDRQQFESVLTSGATAGDQMACVSITEEFKGLSGETASHWVVAPWEYCEYTELPHLGVLENAVYSPSGTWAILISHEQHAVVGGTRDFLSRLERTFPEFATSIPEFMGAWVEHRQQRNANTGWIKGLLEHVHDPGRAEAELGRYGLP